MKARELIVTVGVAGSGKTTWAREICKKYPDYRHVNRDELRCMLFGVDNKCDYRYTKERERLVTRTQRQIVQECLDSGFSVIVSDTNLKQSTREYWKAIAETSGIQFSKQVFNVSWEELKRRNFRRGVDAVPIDTLRRQFQQMQEFLGVKMYTPCEDLPKAIIFDIDGTLAEMRNRHPYEWDKVSNDAPRSTVVEFAKVMKSLGYKIITCSGRDGVCEDETRQWLVDIGVEIDDHFQREQDDRRPDHIVKKEIFFDEIAPRYNVILAVDDRNQVVDMYRNIGVECWQVAPGDF